jgi:thiopurine S-methyltransferase
MFMDPDFWHRRWERNEIAFHASEANPLLVRYFAELSLPRGSRVFLPFCGKTLDIHWLLSTGYRVAGVELSRIAVEQLFVDLGVEPEITGAGELDRYRAEGIDVFVGDLFRLSSDELGPVDAVYDRAAFVALPAELRGRYATHLSGITGGAPRLLISFEYDQTRMDGPPFSIGAEEVEERYGAAYAATLLASVALPDGLKGIPATEHVWLLGRPE